MFFFIFSLIFFIIVLTQQLYDFVGLAYRAYWLMGVLRQVLQFKKAGVFVCALPMKFKANFSRL